MNRVTLLAILAVTVAAVRLTGRLWRQSTQQPWQIGGAQADECGAAGAEREPAGEGEGVRPLLPEPEQAACRRADRHAVQPVRHRDGEAGERADQLTTRGLQRAEQEAHRRRKGNPV
jgi:hypothetical protein